MSESLSPQVQAVLDAFRTNHTGQGCLAAALRAAADQVRTDHNLKRHYAATIAEMLVLDKLLAIAAELENGNN
jgi:hypothetical protein